MLRRWRKMSRSVSELLTIKGNRTPDSFHKELGTLMWNGLRHGPVGSRFEGMRWQ